MNKAKERPLDKVIEAALVIIPEDVGNRQNVEIRLKSVLDSVHYSAPEAMVTLWHRFVAVLSSEFPVDASFGGWKRKLRDLVNGTLDYNDVLGLGKVSLWDIDDVCTVAAAEQGEAIQCAIDEHMVENEEAEEVEAVVVADEALDRRKRREDEGATKDSDPTFRQALESDLKSGREPPFLFSIDASLV